MKHIKKLVVVQTEDILDDDVRQNTGADMSLHQLNIYTEVLQ